MALDYRFFKDMALSEIKSQGYITKGNPALVDLEYPTREISPTARILAGL
ncbi:MAG: hypothetical protein AABW51_04800 [Nanoarchaeota archaeon]